MLFLFVYLLLFFSLRLFLAWIHALIPFTVSRNEGGRRVGFCC